MVIAADGATSRIARALSIAGHPRRPRRWAVGGYFGGVRNEISQERGEDVFGEMHIRSGRYLGIAPMPGGITNACVVTADRTALRDPRTLLCEAFRRDPIVRDRFQRATLMQAPVCLGPLAVESSASGMPGLLLAGDAAGFIDPMTGDGLRFAFRGAELAASMTLEALRDGKKDVHSDLEKARRREFAAKWRFNRCLRALVGSPRGLRIASVGAMWAPVLLEHVIQYAGDARH
jgi:flavin-dependent dehydrogenase